MSTSPSGKQEVSLFQYVDMYSAHPQDQFILAGKRLPPMLMSEVPNIPGMRRDLAASHPNLVKQFKVMHPEIFESNQSITGSGSYDRSVRDNNQGLIPTRVSMQGWEAAPLGMGEDNFSQSGSFYDPSGSFQNLKELTLSVQSFPQQADSFSDISGRYSLRSQQMDRSMNVKALPYSNLETVPHFVANGKEPVCRVLAYFIEKVPYNEVEQERARKMELIFYLEDSTLEIIEPYIPNCGIIQGRMLRRSKVLKPPLYRKRQDAGSDGSGIKHPLDSSAEYYTVTDVYAGSKLLIFQKEFVVIDCDTSTKKLLAEHGIPFGDVLSPPESLYDPRALQSLAAEEKQRQVKSRSPKKSTGFFEFDRKVLRFYGMWDTSAQMFGDSLHVRLHYYLSDNTMEVLPIKGPSEGRDRVPRYLKKTHVLTNTEGYNTDSTFRPESSTSSYSELGPETVGPDSVLPSRPYHWTDIQVGDTIKVAALNITIMDADGFTRSFYSSKQMPLDPAIPIPPPVYPEIDISVPPHNGFGSEADSIQTCKGSLQPKPIRKDEAMLRKHQGMTLRYFSTKKDDESEENARKFIISIYLEDNSISISEPPVRNSGHKGGIFLSRKSLSECTHGTVTPKDFYVDAMIEMFSHKFLIHDADEYTLRYMGENSNIWRNSNIDSVVEKLNTRKDTLSRLILTQGPAAALEVKTVNLEELSALLKRAGVALVKQEIIALFRDMDVYKSGAAKVSKILQYLA